MILKIYTVRDVRTQAYLKPIFLPNDSVLERAIKDSMKDEESMLGSHPEDYAVYSLGTYDDNTGKIESTEPVHLHNIVDLRGA